MSTGALRAAWEAAQAAPTHDGGALRQAWESAQAQQPASPPANPAGAQRLHAAFKSGALAKRMAAENAKDAADAEPHLGFLGTIAAHAANLAQGIPGVEAAEAGVRSLARGQSYKDALSDIRTATGKIPTVARVGERMAGAVPLTMLLPGSAATSGAIIGGADQALSADPDQSLGGRAVRTAIGTGLGGLAGKLVSSATTMGKAAMTPNPQSNVIARMADRASSAKTLFDAAMREGKGREATTAIRKYLAEPEIASRVSALQQLDQFKNVPAESPQMLDALYKSLSDEAKQIGKGLAVGDPSKPNTGRFKLENVKRLKSGLLDAMGTPEQRTVTTDVPALSTAQSPALSLRDAIANHYDRINTALSRKEGTVEQQMARQALERHGAENIVSPPLRGAPVAHTITETEHVPAALPGYADAVEDFAKKSSNIDAVLKGVSASQGVSKTTRPTPAQILSKTPKTKETFAEWVKTATPDQIQAAREGILGDVKNAIHEPGKTFGPFRRAASQGSDLLRATPTAGQTLTETLQKLGLIGVNSSVNNP